MSTKSITVVLAAMLMLTVACDSEIDDQAAAEIVEPNLEEVEQDDEAGEEEEVEELATREVAFDTEVSKIDWVGSKVSLDHDGGFKEWTGHAVVDEENTLKSVEFEVDTTSVWSDDDDLTGHLQSADFFEVEAYPTATFVSSEITEGYDGEKEGATHTVTGDMTIREITETIRFPVTVHASDEQLHMTSEFTLERFDFGIEYKGKTDDLIDKKVLMKLDFTLPLEEAEEAEEAEKAE